MNIIEEIELIREKQWVELIWKYQGWNIMEDSWMIRSAGQGHEYQDMRKWNGMKDMIKGLIWDKILEMGTDLYYTRPSRLAMTIKCAHMINSVRLNDVISPATDLIFRDRRRVTTLCSRAVSMIGANWSGKRRRAAEFQHTPALQACW
jgi:hypothetical protein